MLAKLPASAENLLIEVSQIASELGLEVFLVGGLVRDLFLGCPEFSPDIDLMVLGDASDLLARLEKKGLPEFGCSGEKLSVKPFPDFLTTKVNFLQPCQGLNGFDIAEARAEEYPIPGGRPLVDRGDLKSDLARRDFTINSIAMPLVEGRLGEVVDPFNGLKDLETKQLRILHQNSFVDDPARLIRGARFIGRFGFEWSPETLLAVEESVEQGAIESLTKGRQCTEVLKSLSDVSGFEKTVYELVRLGLLEEAFPQIQLSSGLEEDLKEIDLIYSAEFEGSFGLVELRFQRLWAGAEWPWQQEGELFWTSNCSKKIRKRIEKAREFWRSRT